MGLDQYAYVATRARQREDFFEDAEYNNGNWTNSRGVEQPREIAYWRKHPNLQGWMEQLWHKKTPDRDINSGEDPMFNGVELEITWEDLDELERAVRHNQLPKTSGFFFGNDSDEYYFNHDLNFIKNARAELFVGLKVFYNSSW